MLRVFPVVDRRRWSFFVLRDGEKVRGKRKRKNSDEEENDASTKTMYRRKMHLVSRILVLRVMTNKVFFVCCFQLNQSKEPSSNQKYQSKSASIATAALYFFNTLRYQNEVESK